MVNKMVQQFRIPPYVEEADCVEFCIIRTIMTFLYSIVWGFVFFGYGVIIYVTWIINAFMVVFSKKKYRVHYDMVTKFMLWALGVSMYTYAATDERPTLCP